MEPEHFWGYNLWKVECLCIPPITMEGKKEGLTSTAIKLNIEVVWELHTGEAIILLAQSCDNLIIHYDTNNRDWIWKIWWSKTKDNST